MATKYKLTTIKDIFEKVPADRIKGCMNELAILLAQSKEMVELLNIAGEIVNSEKPEIKCPEEFTWVDDGEGKIVSMFCDHDHKVEIKLSSDTNC